jgi:hypothetical protein
MKTADEPADHGAPMGQRGCVKKWAQYSFTDLPPFKSVYEKRAPLTYKSNFYPRIVPVKIIYFLSRWILSCLWDVYFGRMGLKNRKAAVRR